MNDYGLALKILRKRFSLTQSQLAEKIGVSNHAVSKWENGINQPDVTILQNICKVFDISIDDFLRLASGEPIENVFKENKNEQTDEKSQNQSKKSESSFSVKFLISILICLCFVGVILATIFLVRGCIKDSGSEESGAPEIEESLELGEEIKGTQTQFLNKINSAISLADGISEYDVVGTLKQDEIANMSISYKLVVDKKSGSIVKYYVNCPYENINAYTDFNYVYVTQHENKVRLSASAIDLAGYIEDLEEPYSKDDFTQIKAYKKGYTTQYVFGFTEEYAVEELKEFLDGLQGAILKDCNGYILLSSGGMTERISLTFTYKGKDYEFVATRQLNYNSTFTFPNFSEYKESENVESACQEIENILSTTKILTTFSKVLYSNGEQYFKIETDSASQRKSVAINNLNSAVYYVNGKIYDYSSNYEGDFPYYKITTYDDYYSQVTKSLRYKNLLNLNFSISSSHVDAVFKDQNGDEVDYTIYLNDDGVNYFENQIEIGIYAYDVVKIIISSSGGCINKVEIVDDDKTYSLTIDKTTSITLPDFSSYGALINGTNVISNVKTTSVEQYEFCSEAIVDKNTGDVYTFDNVTVRKYDKNHELIKEFEVEIPSGWCIGKLLGMDWNNIYYSVFSDYSCDFYDDNAVYSLNLTTGECMCKTTNYSYTQIPVCAVNGVIKYEDYYNGLVFGGYNDWDFVYFDTTNNVLVARNIIDGDEYIGAYDYDTDTFKKEKNKYIWEEWLCGEGYYREQVDGETVGTFYSYSDIGKENLQIQYFNVVDRHPKRYYKSAIGAKWQIIKDTNKYTFTTYGVYEKSSGNFVYFPRKAEYRFFSGGVHVWDSGLNFFLDDMYWYTFYY